MHECGSGSSRTYSLAASPHYCRFCLANYAMCLPHRNPAAPPLASPLYHHHGDGVRPTTPAGLDTRMQSLPPPSRGACGAFNRRPPLVDLGASTRTHARLGATRGGGPCRAVRAGAGRSPIGDGAPCGRQPPITAVYALLHRGALAAAGLLPAGRASTLSTPEHISFHHPRPHALRTTL
jgi:hypothetical protein